MGRNRGRTVAAFPAAVGLVLLFGGVLAGCAVPNNMPSESRKAYGRLMDDGLWHVTPPGFEQTKSTDPGCDATWDTMDDVLPKRELRSRTTEDPDDVLRYLRSEARQRGWKVSDVQVFERVDGVYTPTSSDSASANRPTLLDFGASRRVDGHRGKISFSLYLQPDGRITIISIGAVRGLRLCHR